MTQPADNPSVKSARHMHQNRGRPAPKPRATHPNSAHPNPTRAPSSEPCAAHPNKLCQLRANHPGPRATHPKSAGSSSSSEPRAPSYGPPTPEPLQTPRAPSRTACHPSKAPTALLGHVPPFHSPRPHTHPPKLRRPQPQSCATIQTPSSKAACHPIAGPHAPES